MCGGGGMEVSRAVVLQDVMAQLEGELWGRQAAQQLGFLQQIPTLEIG
jgi:hypothetical protein